MEFEKIIGLMDPDSMNPWRNLTLQTLWPQHRSLALEASMKDMVLIKNSQNILPVTLHNNPKYKTFALLGPCINNTVCFTGDYDPYPPAIITPQMSLSQSINIGSSNLMAFDLGCSDGPACANVTVDDIKQMEQIINASDIIIYIGGISVIEEAEGNDRSAIEMPKNQSNLFEKLIEFKEQSGKNQAVISVLTYGAPVIDKFLFNESDAIIGAGYGGEMFGPALVNILNGSFAPSGRTSVTWYQGTSQLPNMTNYDMTKYPGRTYRYLTEYPIYSFGYGLSYVDFEYSNLKLANMRDNTVIISNTPPVDGPVRKQDSVLSITACDTVSVSFDIKNNGNNETGYDNPVDEVSQVYLRVLNNTVITDNIRLVNFTKSFQVNKNESKTVELEINPSQMTVTKDYEYVKIIETGYYQVLVVSSLTLDMTGDYDYALQAMFKVTGANTPLSKCT